MEIAGQVKLDCSCGESWALDIPRHVAQELASEPSHSPSFRELVGLCIGEASTAWDDAGVFDSAKAVELIDRIVDAHEQEEL